MSAAYKPRHRGKRNKQRDREDHWYLTHPTLVVGLDRQGQAPKDRAMSLVSGWCNGHAPKHEGMEGGCPKSGECACTCHEGNTLTGAEAR